MQRTTVRLPDDLLDDAKDLARRTSRTLTQLLEDAVRAELTRIPVPSTRRIAERSVQYGQTRAALRTSDQTDPTVDQSAPAARDQLRAQVADIQAFLRTLPDRDQRSADEILGYDARGLNG